MNRDLVTNINAQSAARATMTIIDALQGVDEAARVIAVTAAFRFVLEAKGFPVNDALQIASRVMYTRDGGLRPEFFAAREYTKREM